MPTIAAMLIDHSPGSGGGSSVPPNTNLGSNLVAWYKLGTGIYDAVSGGSLVSSDGTEIGRWEDQSGNGYHMTRSTAIGTGNLQWSTSVTDRSVGTVNFMNSTGTYLNIPDGLRTTLQTAQAAEIWLRLKNASDAGGNGAWFLGGTNDTHYLYSDGHFYNSTFSNTRYDEGNPTLDTSSAFRVLDTYCTSTVSRAFLDNGALTAEHANSFDTGSTNWRIGRSINSYALNAHVSEIVFSKAKATTTQRDNMYAYLTT